MWTSKLTLSEFHRIVLMSTLNGVGMGLVGIFVPIYLLEIDFSLATVISWLLVHHLTLLLGAFLVVALAGKIGLVRCWYVRVALISLFFFGLFILPDHREIIFLLGALSGLESAFFWIPYNILTVRKTEAASMGASLALMQNAGTISGIFIPAVAAFLIVSFGYPVLFATAAFFILISLAPILALWKESASFSFSFSAIKATIRKNREFIIPEVFDNLGQDAQVIWMLFIFITALSILDIGALGVLIGLIGVSVTYLTGQLTDRWSAKTVMRFGAVATTLLWLVSYVVAVYAPTPIMLYAITALRGFALGIFVTAYGTLMFNRARAEDAQFLVLREVPTILGRVFLFLATLACIAIGQIELTFLLVAALSLYFWFVNIDRLAKTQ